MKVWMASVMTLEYLKTQAAQGRRSDFTDDLSRVPDARASAGDELS